MEWRRARGFVNFARMVKKIPLALLVAFVVVQFIRPAKNVAPGPAGKDDFLVRHNAPAEVRQLFTVGCYDCHSNNTRYPWYAEIQPVGWWLAHHVEDGKDNLNLSELGGASDKRQARRIDAMLDQLSDRVMPLKSYTLIHRDARFTGAQVKAMTDWLESERDKLAVPE